MCAKGRHRGLEGELKKRRFIEENSERKRGAKIRRSRKDFKRVTVTGREKKKRNRPQLQLEEGSSRHKSGQLSTFFFFFFIYPI